MIADYSENGKEYHAGQELFITGKDTQIYFPREEHSAIKYDGKAKNFATAVPAGEARYLMNRMNGEIKTVKGPAMLLPDPRTEVIVRRVLSDRQCGLWYPGNEEAMEYNRNLRSIIQNVPTTRQGAISEGDVERGAKRSMNKGGAALVTAAVTNYAGSAMQSSQLNGDQNLVSEEFSRASTYTQPRTITLETKFQGAPNIDVWTGYAVLVVSKTGKRRVVQGPTTVLLEYDEVLEVLELSTGRPKTTDKLLRVPYLRVENNKVSDVVNIETADHVQVQIYLSYLVDFQGDSTKWFAVENYVKFLCDHIRSVLKGQARKQRVEDFYANSTEFVRDTILGKSVEGARLGMLFAQNGMKVTDVEVLKVALLDERIKPLLDNAQHETVKTNIEVSNMKRNLEVTKQKEIITQEEAHVRAQTQMIQHQLQADLAGSELALTLNKLGNELTKMEEAGKSQALKSKLDDADLDARLGREQKIKDQDLDFAESLQNHKITMLKAEAESIVQRFGAAQGGFSEALLSLSNNETLVKVAQAWDVQKMVAGENLADTLERLFHGTPLKGLVAKLAMNVPATNGNGKHASIS